MYYKRFILVVFLLGSIFSNNSFAITEEEIIKNATKISNRVVPTKLKYHYLKKMWFKGEEYCIDKPEVGVGEYSGIYVQVLIDRVPLDGVCIFEDSVKSSSFILNNLTKELR